MTDFRTHLQGALGSAYTIDRELSGGGMSRVFVAEEAALGRKVVVKVLPPDLTAGVNVDRFRREIQVSAKLQHPHIVPVLSTGEMDGVPYYTMPFVEGESLRARLIRGGALPITEAVGVLRDLAKALAYAHDHGVVHRDIKPDNILLSGGSAAVADFGIAKAISAARDDASHATLTQIGTSLGTPAYMSPEQAAADPATNHRADIYAFGCVAYEVLAARPPFVERSPQRLLAAQMGQIADPITTRRADVPRDLADLVMRCLEKDADARPQSASDLVRVLETVTSGGGHEALPHILLGGPGMLRKALGLYAAAFVVVLIVARAAVIAIGLPDWVVVGAAVVMLLGLPVILFTAYTQRVARRALTATPTFTPGGTPSMRHGTLATVALKASPHLSWRRAGLGGALAIGAFVLLVGGFMLLRALGVGPAGSLFAAGKLAENDRLIVAEFGVKGSADSSLGSVVAEAIRTDLGQSKAVSIASASAVRAALQRMQRSPDAHLDLALARDLARREGIKAVVHGDITPLAPGYIVTARLVNAETGDLLASFRETAGGPTELIPAVEQLSRSLRGKMGESLRSVRQTPPLDQVTTTSLEALRKFTEGNAVGSQDYGRGIALLKEALAIDSGFAMAWRRLSVLYLNGRYPSDVRDSAAARAYRLRDRLTQTERENVEGYYYGSILRDRAREIQVYEGIVSRGEFGPAAHNLALRYADRRELARAESLYRRSIASGQAPTSSYGNLTLLLHAMGRRDAVDSMVSLMVARFGESPYIDQGRTAIHYDRGLLDSAMAAARRVRAGSDVTRRSAGWYAVAGIEAVRGRLDAALRAYDQARALDSARGGLVQPLADSARSAMYDAWYRGNPERAVRRLDAIFARQLTSLPMEQRPYFIGMIAYAMADRPDRARQVLARYRAEVRDTMLLRIDEPMRLYAESEVALAEKRYDEALALFRRSEQLPDGPTHNCTPCTNVMFARVFDAAGAADSAIVYFERYVTEPNHYRLSGEVEPFFRAPSHKRLGELYEARNDRQRALTHYRAFVELWKNADPVLQPAVSDVRRRIARLSALDGD